MSSQVEIVSSFLVESSDCLVLFYCILRGYFLTKLGDVIKSTDFVVILLLFFL